MDYFENSRRAIYLQRQYAIRNPKNIQGIMRIVGGLLLVIGSARDFSGSMESRDDFSLFEYEAFHSALTTVRLLLGQWWLLCHSHRRSSFLHCISSINTIR
jgi:hypothetical protein